MNKILFVGEKETFVIRVLMKKINAPMTEVEFVKCDAVTLGAAMTGDYLIVLYIDDDTKIGDDVVHLLEDHMKEEAGGIIVIGEPAHISSIKRHMSEGFIYKEFTRPVNNEESLIRGWLKDTYKISVANSGLQGIKYLGKNKVDLILLDYEMPITSGPQVLEMLRSDKDTKDIPVIFLTGKSDKNSVMAVVELRPEGYLLKSIQKEELTLKLEEYFAKSK